MPSDVIVSGLYKSKVQDFVQLQTVLALYDQETARNNEQTSEFGTKLWKEDPLILLHGIHSRKEYCPSFPA